MLKRAEGSSLAGVGRNALWLLFTRLANQALGLVATILIARALGEAGLGRYAFVTAVVFIANIVTTFGTDSLIQREAAVKREANIPLLPAALWFQLILSFTIILATFSGAANLPRQGRETLQALQVYSLALIPLAFYTIYSAVLRAFERMDLFLGVNLAQATAQTAGLWAALRFGGDLVAVAWALLAAQTLSAAVAGIYCRRSIPGFRLAWRVRLAGWGSFLRQAWPFALLAGLAVISQRLGVLALSFLTTAEVTGWYAAAARLVEGGKLLHYAFLGALFPVYARLQAPGTRERDGAGMSAAGVSLSRFSSTMLLGSGACIALIFNLLAGPLIQLLFGPGYLPSVAALRLLAWSLIPYSYAARVSLEFVTGGREGEVVWVTAAGLLLSGWLFAWLAPDTHLWGAGLAVLAGEGFQAGAYWVLVHGTNFRRRAIDARSRSG